MNVSPKAYDELARALAEATNYDELRISVDFPTEDTPQPSMPVVEFWSKGKLIFAKTIEVRHLQLGVSGVRLRLGGIDGGLQGALATDHKVTR